MVRVEVVFKVAGWPSVQVIGRMIQGRAALTLLAGQLTVE
jgi:hypothetical protein